MTDLAGQRVALGEELRFLARRHPREGWARHANLGEVARFWLQRHELFRRLDETIRSGTEAGLDQPVAAAEVRPWLDRHLRWFLWQLEEHHQVEDLHYVPVFRRAEPRLAAGFQLLEGDHEALHLAIRVVVDRAHLVLADRHADGAAFCADLARFRDAQVDLGRQLVRHLDDEEELVIPLLLERGEDVLLGRV